MPVDSSNAAAALCNVRSGEHSNGSPFLSKNEHNMHKVGISENGLTNAVRKRGITYKSLLSASINEGNKLEPSTRSPSVNIVSR